MIAYLFFHEALSEADRSRYEDGLRRFHAALAEASVPGLVESRSYRVGGRYCDWYVVESSAALDHLNSAAVSGARSSMHAAVAQHATNFTGKLMMLAAGTYDAEAHFEIRFAKPPGMAYADLYSRLRPWTERGDTSLWRRMMVLGPPPEFCLLARSEEELPQDLGPIVFRREPL